jgi:hypothetical protein
VNARAIIATLLATILLIFIIGSFTLRYLGEAGDYIGQEATVIAWKDILMTITGGLIAYIGGENKNG